MQLSEAKKLFRIGQIKSVDISKMPMSEEYTVTFHVSPNVVLEYGNQLHAQRGDVRTFKTIDAAARSMQSIGFDRATLLMGGR